MHNSTKVIQIQDLIIQVRNQKVMLDRDLAKLYWVPTRALIQAVKRNWDRFPADFVFQMNDREVSNLVSQNVIPPKKYYGGRNPYVFTRNGANMLSAVIRSKVAVKRSIQIMRAFSSLEIVASRQMKGVGLSPKVMEELSTHSKAIAHLFQTTKMTRKDLGRLSEIQKGVIKILQQLIWQAKTED